MKDIYSTFPDVSKLEILKTLAVEDPYINYVMFGIIQIVISISILIKIGKFFKSKKAKSEKETKKSWIILVCILFVLTLIPFNIYTKIMLAYDKKEAVVLEIDEVNTWYTANASKMDEELNEKEIFIKDFKVHKRIIDEEGVKQTKSFLKGMGWKYEDTAIIRVTKENGKELPILIPKKDVKMLTKNSTLKIKYTYEYGKKYNLGYGIVYGRVANKEQEEIK